MKNRLKIYEKLLKRPIDFILSLIAIIILSPIFLLVAIFVKFKLGSPVIFKQKRPGLNENIFIMYKFRTMTDDKDKNGNVLSDDIRLTKFGRWLRSTSLDELPELFNILKGDMSIVGPRPQLVRDMVFMSTEQRTRHNALPGLTGLAQVNGRNGIDWETKLLLDVKYIQSISFLLDFKIVFSTIGKVFAREGINADGMDTAEDYGEYLLRQNLIKLDEYHSKMNKAKILNKSS